MPGVIVNIDALRKARRSLSNFSSNMENMAATAANRAEECKIACQRAIADTEASIQELDDKIRNWQDEHEVELESVQRLKSKYADKLERLQTEWRSLSIELDHYVAAMRRFEGQALSLSDVKQNAVDKCVAAIDRYLGVQIHTK